MARQKPKKEQQWIGDRSYTENGRPQDAPCPKCGETERIQRKSYGCWINYCYVCHIFYDVPPAIGEDGLMIIAGEPAKKKPRKKKAKKPVKKKAKKGKS